VTPLEFFSARADVEACALVTILAIHGSAPRRPGAQIAVTANAHCGSLSGGCLDQAVLAAARAAIAEQQNTRLRIGAGSEWLDIRLPCGSDLVLQIDAAMPKALQQHIAECVRARQSVRLCWTDDAGRGAIMGTERSDAELSVFQADYAPALRLVCAGGANTLPLFARVAEALGLDVWAISPDAHTLELLPASVQRQRLQAHEAFQAWAPTHLDRYSALVTLFHEHDWEHAILAAALSSQAFWIGAMGSKKAHSARLQALRELGLDDHTLRNVRAPIGVLPQSKTPELLSLSILCDILADYEANYATDVRVSDVS
jgi:xanthine dehydrogenase accessory factor